MAHARKDTLSPEYGSREGQREMDREFDRLNEPIEPIAPAQPATSDSGQAPS